MSARTRYINVNELQATGFFAQKMTDKVYPNALRFDLGPTEIVELGQKIIEESKQTLDVLAKTEDPTWDTILLLNDEASVFASEFSNCYFPSNVSPDKR